MERVGDAMRADLIDAIDARILLDLRMDDPLPDELKVDARRRAPLRDEQTLAMRHAATALWYAYPERKLIAVHPRRDGEEWVLDVVEPGHEASVVATVRLSNAFEVVEMPDLAGNSGQRVS